MNLFILVTCGGLHTMHWTSFDAGYINSPINENSRGESNDKRSIHTIHRKPVFYTNKNTFNKDGEVNKNENKKIRR